MLSGPVRGAVRIAHIRPDHPGHHGGEVLRHLPPSSGVARYVRKHEAQVDRRTGVVDTCLANRIKFTKNTKLQLY